MRITQPKDHEPIRLIETKAGPRWRVVLDVSAKGQPRRQVTKTFGSLKAARQYVNETRAALARGTFLAPDRATLAGLVDAWLASKRSVRPITRSGYLGALRPALDRLGARPVQMITRADVEQLVTWADAQGGKLPKGAKPDASGKPLSQRSISYMLITLRQVLDFALDAGLVSTNVAARVQAPRRTADDHRPRTVWTPAQMVAFRTLADRDPWAGVWRLVMSGLRRSEVLGLSWPQVDLDAGTVTVVAGRVLLAKGATSTDEPKSAASRRTVPVEQMHPGTIALLKALRAAQAADRLAAGTAWPGSDLVVLDALGRPVHPDRLTDGWRALCREAGVPETGTHSARHAVATMLHGAGVAPADASALLGHGLGVHLAVYVQQTQAGVTRAADSLGKLLAAEG